MSRTATTRKEAQGNILLVANWESNVGYAWWLMENFWINIAEHFQEQGRHSILIYPRITQLPETIEASSIETLEISFTDHNLGNLLRIRQLIKQHDIRHIYLSDARFYGFFYLLLRFFGIRSIMVHDHTPGDRTEATGMRKLIKSLLHRIPFYNVDLVIAVSNFVHQRHLKVSCIPADRCATAPNGIHPYNLSGIDRGYLRQQFDIPSDRLVVVTTGRASYYKGIDFFIRCAHQLIYEQGINQLHFLFCGDGPEIDNFKALSKELALDKHFTFAGKRSDIDKILPCCDIGFHAAEGEVGYSLSILEYMSAGLATIVPDRPSTSGATIDGETGLIYKHRDITSACEAITRCLPENDRKKLADNAIADIASHYDISNTNKALMSAITEVTG